jgi:hypothetical protein
VEPAFVFLSVADAARLSFGPPFRRHNDADFVYFEATLTDAGLHANTTATIAVFDPVQLDGYLAALAADWRGWDGSRVWRSTEGELRIEATHDRTRYVTLAVTVQPSQAGITPTWSARCTFDLEPGEQLTNLASDVAAFLGPAPHRYRM